MQKRAMVFGIGLSKTGTTSLDGALELLRIPSVHYPDPALMVAGRFERALEGYGGATDITVAAFFRELDAAYPGSKFVLTVRDLESWLESVEYHLAARDIRKYLGDSPAGIVREIVYGRRDFERQSFAAAYRAHREAVRLYFAERPADLLVMDICAGDGWEKLCPFLGVDAPAAAFPHLHKRAASAA